MGLFNFSCDCAKRVAALEQENKKLRTDIDLLESNLDIYNTNLRSLRGLINKKFSKSSPISEDEDDAPSAKSGGIFLPKEEADALRQTLIDMGYQPK